MCGFYRCTECLLCYTVCPTMKDPMNLSKFAGPAAMLRIGTRYYDPRDEENRVNQAVDEGLEHCTMCGLCHKACYLGMESAKDLIRPCGAFLHRSLGRSGGFAEGG